MYVSGFNAWDIGVYDVFEEYKYRMVGGLFLGVGMRLGDFFVVRFDLIFFVFLV